MPTLFADIDNTLIYSHRLTITSPKRVVEFLNGKEQSYMTEFTYSFLTGKHDLQIVPVTTRTLQQYQRLENLILDLGCEYSLICNGAILLNYFQIDQAWYEETLRMIESEIPEIAKAEKWMKKYCNDGITYSACGLFVYSKCMNPQDLALFLRQYVDTEKVDVMYDHRKLYCIPKSINKGIAIKRFSQRFNVGDSIAIGDSSFDISMLNQASVSIVPQKLGFDVQNKNTIICDAERLFSDEICRVISALYP